MIVVYMHPEYEKGLIQEQDAFSTIQHEGWIPLVRLPNGIDQVKLLAQMQNRQRTMTMQQFLCMDDNEYTIWVAKWWAQGPTDETPKHS